METNDTKCPHCQANTCPAEDDGYFCTREKGHDGDHVACISGGKHYVHTWKHGSELPK